MNFNPSANVPESALTQRADFSVTDKLSAALRLELGPAVCAFRTSLTALA